jgi:hypothetical protein
MTTTYIGEDEVEDALLMNAPGRYGYVALRPPRHEAGMLYMAELTVRSRTAINDEVIDNPDGPRRHATIARIIRRELRRPTLAWNIADESSGVAYREIGYTVGAEELLRSGTAWMQPGVANIRFGIERFPRVDQ